MNRQPLLWSLAAAGLLTACGGGGGDSAGTPASPSSNNTTVNLVGVASKGLLANADVSVHSVKSDGTIDLGTVLASAVTNATGQYSLTFNGPTNQPYVVRVSAKSDGSTTHLDEVTQQAQALPETFVIRALITPTTSGAVTTTASITPFSELAVAAAAKATGGITASNAQQATATVAQLLGFNPTQVEVKTTGTAASADEQKQAVLLSAVSKMANDGALGCNTGTAGAKTQCVVNALADSASTTSLRLQSGSIDVSAALVSSVTTVLSDSTLSGTVNAANLTTVVANLGCTNSGATGTTNCNPATASSDNTVAAAIASAKLIITQFKSDLLALFSAQGSSTPSALVSQADTFKAAMQDITVPAELLAKDSAALLMGLELLEDFKSGATTDPQRARLKNGVKGKAWLVPYNAVGCTLYQDQANTVVSTTGNNANFIGCRAGYYVQDTWPNSNGNNISMSRTEWLHGFTVEVPNSGNTYSYTSNASSRQYVCSGSYVPQISGTCTPVPNGTHDLQATPRTGTITITRSNGTLTAVTLAGELPGSFVESNFTLFNDHHTWDVSGTVSTSNDDLTSTSQTTLSSVRGTVVAYSSADNTTRVGTLNLKNGQLGLSDLKYDGARIGTQFDIDLAWSTPTAEFEGTISVGNTKLLANNSGWAPTTGSLTGAARTLSNGTATEFVSGSFSLSASNYANYDATLPDSTSNRYQVSATFIGKVTATNRPALELTVGTSMYSNETRPSTVSLQYRSFAAGQSTPRLALNGALTVNPANSTRSLVLTDASSKLSFLGTGSPKSLASFKVKYDGNTEIGTVDTSNQLLTFIDGSTMSIDSGL